MESAATLYHPPRFIAGLDVGQMQDPSALVILDREMRLLQGQLEPYYFCGHLERIPLQTPYPVMVRGVRERVERIGERCVLVIDATGVGQGVVDLFREAWTTYDSFSGQRQTLPGKPTIVALTFTHGSRASSERWDTWTVPMLDIIMRLVVVLQQRRLTAAQGLEEFPMLVKEAQAFQWRVATAKDDDPYLSFKSGAHDDLLKALASAVWWAEKYSIRTMPSLGWHASALPAGNPLARMGGRRR